ncbi:MAG: hypothetical protein AAGD00_10645 [Planctomycetota bacterium]
MYIESLTNADALPTLAASMQFAARRHELITHNIANLSTPMFQPKDVSVRGFQENLGEAIDGRRRARMGNGGPLNMESSREVKVSAGRLSLEPEEPSGNVLFHDRNNRDLERTMQDLAENFAALRVTSELMRSRMGILSAAITLRP